jgi:hypothetical protein
LSYLSIFSFVGQKYGYLPFTIVILFSFQPN